MAEWLNVTFSAFDSAIINGISTLHCGALTFFCRAITFLFEKGILLFVISGILLLFKKTRKTGMILFGAVAFGAFFTNIVLKNWVARERPMFVEEFSELWREIGSPMEGKYSFPSGHATSIMAFATVLFITCDKKWSYVGFIVAFIVGLCRIYLIAHYPTDVISGYVLGVISAFISEAIVYFAYKIIEKNKDKGLFKFWLNFDIIELFTKEKQNEKNN